MAGMAQLILLSLIRCGGNLVNIAPDYGTPHFQGQNLLRDNAEVSQVYDNRNVDPHHAGTARVGFFSKKVPYGLEESVADFVKESVNRMISSQKLDRLVTPIVIYIDTPVVFESIKAFSEYGHFICSLRFKYPLDDSTVN